MEKLLVIRGIGGSLHTISQKEYDELFKALPEIKLITDEKERDEYLKKRYKDLKESINFFEERLKNIGDNISDKTVEL